MEISRYFVQSMILTFVPYLIYVFSIIHFYLESYFINMSPVFYNIKLLTWNYFNGFCALKRDHNRFKKIYTVAQGNLDFERHYPGILYRKLLGIENESFLIYKNISLKCNEV